MPIPRVIANFLLEQELGSGFSGSIYRATHIHTQETVALKIQDVDHECPTNIYERAFYPALQGGVGMPTLWAAGVDGKWDYLAIDLLGPSLETLFRRSEQDTMDLRSVCCIAMQLITRLEFMHSRGLLHRDIQLGNCVIGLPPHDTTIYMIDFGFSKFYIDRRTRRHIPDSKAKRDFIGNYWFSSVGVHCRGKVPSRRDDLEAAALMLIHLLTPGGLSWTRNGVPRDERQHDRIKREKRAARPEELCKGLPVEFEEFLRYCRRLKFSECPDYEKWREEFRELAKGRGFPESDAFVWPPPVVVSQAQVPSRHPRTTLGESSVQRVLNDLANLKLDERQVLGDRKNIVEGPREETKANKAGPSTEVIVISDDDSSTGAPNPAPIQARTNKAKVIMRLNKEVQDAANNNALSDVVTAFVTVLQSSRARNLTKEGFVFLDALYKQLANPSVFIVPLRTSRSRQSEHSSQPPEEARHIKLNALATLRREVVRARSNRALAKMVADFGALIDKSTVRTVTKDGIGFLEGLAARLRALDS